MRWGQADRVEVRLEGDQEEMGSVRMRTRIEPHGSNSSFRVYGGAVALRLELILCFVAFPTAPLASYRSGKSV